MSARSGEHTEDLIQDTYLAIVRNIASYRGEASFLTWVYTIARTAHGRRRRHEFLHTRRAEALALVSRLLDGAAASTRPLDDLVAVSELGRLVTDALAALSETDREVLLRRDLEGWSAREVADHLGLTVPAVKTRLHRARTTLRARLSIATRAPWG